MSGSTEHIQLFQEQIRCLATALRCEFALIGVLDQPGRRVDPIAVLDQDEPGQFAYDIGGTPCAITLRDGPFVVRSGVSERFPDDQTIVHLQSQAYLSYPFQDPVTGRAGLIAGLRRTPLDEHADVLPILSAFAESVTTARLAQITNEDNAQLGHALDTAGVGFAVVSRDGVFIRGNARARAYFGVRGDGSLVLTEPCGTPRGYRLLCAAVRAHTRWAGRFEAPAFCGLPGLIGTGP
ncbi:MAG: hypothetical protein K8E66_00350, partial [Phycisphaerales bacterium]|nr:hypothetical protein [Phycisphaerales bacterium]